MSSDDNVVVLFVDDDAVNLRVFEANFGKWFNVLTCDSGQAALDLVCSGKHEIAVLLADERMPLMTGSELLEKVTDLSPDTQRMVVTAYADMHAVMNAVNRAKVCRYYYKPWVREELHLAIEDAVLIYRLERQVRTLRGRLLEIDRGITLGLAADWLTHDLLQPLTSAEIDLCDANEELVALGIELAKRPGSAEEVELRCKVDKTRALLHDVLTAFGDARDIVKSLRAGTAPPAASEQCDLESAVKMTIGILGKQAPDRVQIVVEGLAVNVPGALTHWVQVLLNLVQNAMQASAEAGRSVRVLVHWQRVGQIVEISVQDNGPGVAPGLRDRIFDPLFTTRARNGGTGLGLPIAREIVTRLGGELLLDSSSPEQGARFRLSVPAL